MAERKTRLGIRSTGLEMLRQEYVAALSDLYSDQSLAPEARQRRVRELASEYRQRRAQEMHAIKAQMRADAQAP